MSKIPERNEQLKKGLLDMIVYINQFHKTKELSILEIGSWTGVSSEIFAQNFKFVFCVDPWAPTGGINKLYNMAEVEKKFDYRMSKYDNFEKIKMTSKEFAEKNKIIEKDIDIVYIDGLHTYEAVKEDIELWVPCCKLYISGHDYWKKKFPGVIKAVNEILGTPDKIFCDTSWIKKIG